MRELLLILVLSSVVFGQQVGKLSWDSKAAQTTINAQPAGVFDYTLPARSGTFALLADIPATSAPVVPEQRGRITLVNGTGSVVLTGFTQVPTCIPADPSGNSVKYTPTATSLTVWGVGPVIDYSCK